METIINKGSEGCEKLESNLKSLSSTTFLGMGGFGEVHTYDVNKVIKISTRDIVIDGEDEYNCVNNMGCKNDILMEGLILSVLDELHCQHIPKFHGLHKCGNKYYLIMEKIIGETYTNCYRDLNNQQKLVMLFQLTYTLYIANKYCNFVHGDLIGQNIMISDAINEIDEYTINGNVVRIKNHGIKTHIIDFGKSRLKYNNIDTNEVIVFQKHNITSIPRLNMLMTPEFMFDGRADICKIYSNPNIKRGLNLNIPINDEHVTLEDVTRNCNAETAFYVAVPPFPEINHIQILFSDLFKPIRL